MNGNIIADSASSALVGRNLKDYIPNAWSQESANKEEIIFSDTLMQSEVTGKWAMPAIKLVKDSNNQNAGYIYMFYLIGLYFIKHIFLI
ncbi:hypothetical protein [Brachyspira intermedia]